MLRLDMPYSTSISQEQWLLTRSLDTIPPSLPTYATFVQIQPTVAEKAGYYSL